MQGPFATRFEGVYAVGDVTAIPLSNGGALPKAGVVRTGRRRGRG